MVKEAYTQIRKAMISAVDTGYCRIYYKIPFVKNDTGRVGYHTCCLQQDGKGAEGVVLYAVNPTDGWAEPEYPVEKAKADIFFELPDSNTELGKDCAEYLLKNHNCYKENRK